MTDKSLAGRLINMFHRCDSTVRLDSIVLSDEVSALESENAARKQIIADVFDDMECLPSCDDYGHDDECPAVYANKAFASLRRQLAEAQERIKELESGINQLSCGYMHGERVCTKCGWEPPITVTIQTTQN